MQHILCPRRAETGAGRGPESAASPAGRLDSVRPTDQAGVRAGKGPPDASAVPARFGAARDKRCADRRPAVSHLGGCAASARRSCCGARSPVPPACCPCPAWARSTILHSAARFVERRGAGRLQGQARQSGGRGRDGWGVSRSASQEMCQTRNARLEIAKASTKRPL